MPAGTQPTLPTLTRSGIAAMCLTVLLAVLPSVAGTVDVTKSVVREEYVRATVDHVIVVVRDLEEAARRAQDAGFSTKPGRLHANGLHNLHVEFADGTELEFMSLVKLPTDDISRRYQAFLNQGEGPVYLALRTDRIKAVYEAATRLGFSAMEYDYPAWKYLVLSDDSGLSQVFFIQYKVQNDNSGVEHPNRAVGTKMVSVSLGQDASARLKSLLSSAGTSAALEYSTSGQGIQLQAGPQDFAISGVTLCTSTGSGNDEQAGGQLYGLLVEFSSCELTSAPDGGEGRQP